MGWVRGICVLAVPLRTCVAELGFFVWHAGFVAREDADTHPGPDSHPAMTVVARIGRLLVERDVVALADSADRVDALEALDAALKQARCELRSELAGEGLLAWLAASLHLAQVEVETLALCVAADVDTDTARLLAVAGGLTVGALHRILGPDAVLAVADDAMLRRAALVDVDSDGPLVAAPVSVPRVVAWAFAGVTSPDASLNTAVEYLSAPPDRADGARRVLACSPDRVRRVQAAVLTAHGSAFAVSPPPHSQEGWEALARQATLAGCGIVLDVTEVGPDVRAWISRARHLTWALVSPEPLPLDALPREPWVEAAVDRPAVTDGEWRGVFGSAPVPARRPTASQLRALAPISPPGTDPAVALHRLAAGTLLAHARRVTPSVGWDDLVLPATQQRLLQELARRLRYRETVHEKWGIPAYPSPGVVALFSGPSGTGKTTAAEMIANDLGFDLFRVDLSALVSKYIGETEKNLEQVFSAANAGSYVLLFDEADSLFGSRSKVSDARDRYANIEVSYLLQRLESYDGFVVLTSNYQGNIDPAFLRRISVTVHFALPTPPERAQIWRRCLSAAPTDELDLDFVATQFDLAGGAIRNAALSAAFLAAARQAPVGMADVLQAVHQELAKLGRRSNEAQFGRWAREVLQSR
jgi:hypothetical protein